MKKFATVLTPLILTLALWAGSAFAYDIDDEYIGGNPNWSSLDGQDRIGLLGDFETYGMDVVFDPDSGDLTIDIYSTFFDGSVGTYGVGLGDLFISTDGWDPDLTGPSYAPTSNDNYGNGEDWEYAVVLDNHYGPAGVEGTASLYGVVESNIVLSNDVTNPAYGYRQYQEVQYNPNGQNPVTTTGSWSYGSEKLHIEISLAGIDIGKDLAFHYAMTCANDVIEGKYSVPEPSTMLLFGIGLIGMVGLGRKKFLKR